MTAFADIPGRTLARGRRCRVKVEDLRSRSQELSPMIFILSEVSLPRWSPGSRQEGIRPDDVAGVGHREGVDVDRGAGSNEDVVAIALAWAVGAPAVVA